MTTSTIRSKQESKLKKWQRTAAAVLFWLAVFFWLAVWQCAAFFVGKEVLIPAPALVVQRLWQLAGRTEFWITAFSSLWRVLLGFAAALAAGVLLAVLTAAFCSRWSLLFARPRWHPLSFWRSCGCKAPECRCLFRF